MEVRVLVNLARKDANVSKDGLGITVRYVSKENNFTTSCGKKFKHVEN